MRLYLSGGGSGEKSLLLDKLFASAIKGGKPLLYIPIAIDKAKHPYPDCLKWINKTFNPLGINKIELWTEQDLRKKPETESNKFGGVYVGGGNTFYLLRELRDSGFIEKLKALIKNDVPFYGGSAGALICTKTIITALTADKNEVNLIDFNAMNFLKGHALWCHYTPEMSELVKKYVKKHELRIIALPENTGLHVTQKEIRVVGPGSAYLFTEKIKEIRAGQKI